MRSEATAHRHRDPPPHNKYGKSQVHKTRNDLIDTISKVIYRSWLCLPFITHFGQVLFRSFPSSRVAVRVNLLLFVLKDLVRHWECSQIPSPRMFLLYSVFHTHFLCHLAHIYCLGAGRRCLVPTGKPLPSPYLTPISFSSLETHRVTQTQTRPGPGQSHLPAPGPRFSAKALPGHTPGQQPQHCPHQGTFAGVTLKNHNATSTVSPTTSSPLPPGTPQATAHPKIQRDQRGKTGKKAETAPG